MINWPRSSPGHQFCIFALPFPIQPIFPIVQYQIFSVLGTELNNVCILSPYWQIWGAYAQSEWDKTNHGLPVEGLRGLSFIWRRWFFRLWEVCLKRFLNGFKNTCCQYTDDLVPLMEFTNEQLGAASREIFTGLDILIPPVPVFHLFLQLALNYQGCNIGQWSCFYCRFCLCHRGHHWEALEGDGQDWQKEERREGDHHQGRKAGEHAKGPGELLRLKPDGITAKNPRASLERNSMRWRNFGKTQQPPQRKGSTIWGWVGQILAKVELRHCFAEQRRKLEHVRREVPDTSDASDNSSEADWRCEEGGKDVCLSSTQSSFFLQLYAINQAKDDHKERVDRATEIKNQINKTFAAVLDANAVLQVSKHNPLEKCNTFFWWAGSCRRWHQVPVEPGGRGPEGSNQGIALNLEVNLMS